MELFEHIERKLKMSNLISLDTWGSDIETKLFHEMVKFYDPNAPVVRYEGVTYLITHHDATNGMGGMSEGSPETFMIKKVEPIVDITKSIQRPRPVENPDFKPLIKMLEETMDEIVAGNHNSDGDDDHYAWETAMQCVYGRNIFDWYNENVT
jgi:hypothetical protein